MCGFVFISHSIPQHNFTIIYLIVAYFGRESCLWVSLVINRQLPLGWSLSALVAGFVTRLLLCSLSLNFHPVPHFWEPCPCMVSCSGPQFLPGIRVLSLKSILSLAESLSPAARPAMRVWDVLGPPSAWSHPRRLVKSLGLCFPCSGMIPGLGSLRIEGKIVGRGLGEGRGVKECECMQQWLGRSGDSPRRKQDTYETIYSSSTHLFFLMSGTWI